MKVSDLRESRQRLTRFLKRFDCCIKTSPSRKHLRTYVGGQVSGLERKSVEPIALAAGVAPRTLQEFLGIHRWDAEKMCRRVQEVVQRDYGDENAICVIDETSYAKKGNKTAGVQRQYCGCTGKKDNCVVTVDLGYVANGFHTLIDAALYLPEETWHQDRDRCRQAGIPDDVVYRPKWQIALELIERTMANGVKFKYLTADELYGRCGEFRRKVAAMGLTYVVEVPCNTTGWTKRPTIQETQFCAGSGRPGIKTRLVPNAPAPRRVDKLWKRGGPSWEKFLIKETEKGPAVWEIRAVRFSVRESDLPADDCWLLVARNVQDGEIKYYLSNAPQEAPLEEMLHVAFNRWRVERIFQDAKGQVGLDRMART